MATNKINSLQMLRAVAVILVIFIHLVNFVEITSFKAKPIFYYFFHLNSWGAIGVDLFFTISGFIMTIVAPAYQGNGKWKEFLLKRAIRIIPIYYLVSFVIFLSYTFHNHLQPNIPSILKTILFLPFFDAKQFTYPLLAVGWSLSYEVYFYILIAVFLILKGNIYKKLLIVILVLSVIGAIADPTNPLLKFLTSPVLIEFALGVLAGLIYKRVDVAKPGMFKPLAIVLIIAGISLMAVTIFTGNYGFAPQEAIENNNRLAMLRALVWGLPCASLLLGVVILEKTTQFTTAKVFVILGDASYSAYLLHLKINYLFSKAFALTHLSSTIFTLIAIPVCLAVSVVFYKLIERPVTAKINNYFFRQKEAV